MDILIILERSFEVPVGDMSVEVISKFENKYLFRTEYIFKMNHEAKGTPSRKEVRALIAKALNVPEDRIVIRKIKTPFGVNEAYIEAFVYESKDKMFEIEPRHILIRNGILEK